MSNQNDIDIEANGGVQRADSTRQTLTDAHQTAGAQSEREASGTVDIDDLTKLYDLDDDGVVTVEVMNQNIDAEEVVTVLGPSGRGEQAGSR
ncbi:hypothetical protein [Halococcus thailandensis]|uniref:Uncharacterized protein n=1 Tax=Halococcus thailandensis JCM 13552 TaxID=1227457 RepID=M0N5A5_9EURY|nr:hypothetical protein [Halococcus thailandensis]EMA51880.1 hypothetical protein C451_14041 [Halococcus thailandensis JCM 13552]